MARIPHPARIKPTLSLVWKTRHFFTLRLPGAARRAHGASADSANPT